MRDLRRYRVTVDVEKTAETCYSDQLYEEQFDIAVKDFNAAQKHANHYRSAEGGIKKVVKVKSLQDMGAIRVY